MGKYFTGASKCCKFIDVLHEESLEKLNSPISYRQLISFIGRKGSLVVFSKILHIGY